jgi:8-oxo-dGTP diphosphatase
MEKRRWEDLRVAYQHTALALARKEEAYLLVKHRGSEPLSWWLPGGVVEPGEGLVEALQREMQEETGLQLEGTPVLAFVVQLFQETQQGLREAGFAFHFSCQVTGEVHPQDPDGLVVEAAWKEKQEMIELLSVHAWYDCEPLRRWFSGEAGMGTVYTRKIVSQ